jgi:3-oxoacyl-[acyl-carrier-protein] synthase II
MGVVSPVGNDVDTFWESLCTGKSGIGRLDAFDPSALSCRIAGQVRDVDFSNFVEAKEVKRTDRFILLAMAAADQAVKDANIEDLSVEEKENCGTIIGSGIGGLSTLESEHRKLVERGPRRVSPFLIPMLISDMASGMVSMKYGFKGPNYCVVSACASATHAMGDAFMGIKTGMMDMAVTGGTEATITPLAMAGFCNMKALSTRNDTPTKASSPFDSKRDGFVMGEGAGIVVLESLEHALARNAKIYAEFLGYGATGDAHHLSEPAPEGEGAARAMKRALKSAQIQPTEVDYINAHGTSTPKNDKFESHAIRTVYGDHTEKLSISSTKSMTGHLLGASGGIECIAGVMATRDNIIPPTINYEDPDPECTLNYTPNEAVKRTVNTVMSNSFGFGGHNASVILRKYVPSENDG